VSAAHRFALHRARDDKASAVRLDVVDLDPVAVGVADEASADAVGARRHLARPAGHLAEGDVSRFEPRESRVEVGRRERDVGLDPPVKPGTE